MATSATMEHGNSVHAGRPYLRLAIMAALSFVAMYILMYAMVAELADALPNVNQAYMAGLMTAPMVILELALMGMMYSRRRLNLALIAASLLVGLICLLAIRQQFLIADREFLRSMIPHHAAAILMCREAPIVDPDIRELCGRIVSSQQAEIDLMYAMLARSP